MQGRLYAARAATVLVGLLSPCLTGCGDDGGSATHCAPFVSIAGGTFERQGTRAVWTLTVAAMAKELVFNKGSVPANVVEYRWGVALDQNDDGTPDFRVDATHYKSGAEQRVTDIVGTLSHDVFEASGAAFVSIATPEVTLAGNTFTFSTDDGDVPELAGILTRSQVTWSTAYHDGVTYCEDALR